MIFIVYVVVNKLNIPKYCQESKLGLKDNSRLLIYNCSEQNLTKLNLFTLHGNMVKVKYHNVILRFSFLTILCFPTNIHVKLSCRDCSFSELYDPQMFYLPWLFS